MNRIAIAIIAVLGLISVQCSKDDTVKKQSEINITIDNAQPIELELGGDYPPLTGKIKSTTLLKTLTATQINSNGENIVLEEISLDEVSEYSFSINLVINRNTTGVKIEVEDINSDIESSLVEITPLLKENIDAFPGAQGYARYTTGGRGGKILVVDRLDDDYSEGSLRWAINQSGARTIVFKVSGNIELVSPLNISNGDLTIAGQSAPGDGICICKNYMQLKDGLDNVIIRYLRFRAAKGSSEYDAAWGRNCSNIIIDHCTFSWGNDEVASFYDNTNFTMQWCLISESFYNSTHPKGEHGYGGIWGGMGASFHHNLIAHHTSRNPRFCGARFHEETRETEIVDFRNNVIYNWGSNSAYGGEMGQQNMVNNYYKSGPATSSSKRNRIVEISSVDSKWYIDGNYVEGYSSISNDNWAGGVQGSSSNTIVKATTPFDFGDIETQTALEAYTDVLESVGASKSRDDIDTRIINEVKTGTATYGGSYGANTGIIDSESEVGGFPVLEQYNEITDNDNDGMDDSWEDTNGLDSNNSDDHLDYTLDDYYTNIEIYLNSLLN